MGSVRPWPVVGTEDLEDCTVFRVRRVDSRSPWSGRVHPFYRIEAEDWVNVVPITPDGHVVMVRQYRHGSRSVTLEIPGGIVDRGETPGEAAARELSEETGYRAGSVEAIGVLNPNPALFGNCVHSFVARDVVPQGAIQQSELEETLVELVPLAEVPEVIRAGQVDHALVVAAFHWLALAGSVGGR